MPRTILFLQGPPSIFTRDLARELERLGTRTLRINLCLGDWLFWQRGGAVNYRGRLEDWRAFLSDYVAREAVTDIVYYADRLPYHVIAGEVAAAAGINAIALEFGYLRPDWITLEHGGMSAYSHFPDEPEIIRAAARDLPEVDTRSIYPFPHALEAIYEVVFNLTTYFDLLVFPHYKADRMYDVLVEYVSHLPRIALTWWNRRRAKRAFAALRETGRPFYLFALQIDADYQLRANAAFADQPQAADLVIRSFAANAPADTVLLVKQHPLDHALKGWKKRVRSLAARHGVADRVLFFRAGNLEQMLGHARGTVLVNSTVGIHAVRRGLRVKALGIAIFDIPGLTFQGPLDEFWTTEELPDRALCTDFVRLLAGTIQIRGNFYSRAGRRAAARAAALRLADNSVNQPGAFVPVPPRLARARRMGVQHADALGRQLPPRGMSDAPPS